MILAWDFFVVPDHQVRRVLAGGFDVLEVFFECRSPLLRKPGMFVSQGL